MVQHEAKRQHHLGLQNVVKSKPLKIQQLFPALSQVLAAAECTGLDAESADDIGS